MRRALKAEADADEGHRVKVYSGGTMIGEWITTGAVLNEGPE